MDNEVISIAAAFARCLRASRLDVSVALGCKSLARRNVFAVTDDTINRDSELADEERGNQSKNYENQTKTEFAKFRTHTRIHTKGDPLRGFSRCSKPVSGGKIASRSLVRLMASLLFHRAVARSFMTLNRTSQ